MSSEFIESSAAFFWSTGTVVQPEAVRRSAAPSASAAKRRLCMIEVFLAWKRKGKRLRVSPPRAGVVKRGRPAGRNYSYAGARA
jgi:hypothetical protein